MLSLKKKKMVASHVFFRSSSTYAKIKEWLGRMAPKVLNNAHFSLASLSVRPLGYITTVAGSFCRQRYLSGQCRACLVLYRWQVLPYAVLGLGRDGANSLASSRLETWALEDSTVEKRYRKHKVPTQISRYICNKAPNT